MKNPPTQITLKPLWLKQRTLHLLHLGHFLLTSTTYMSQLRPYQSAYPLLKKQHLLPRKKRTGSYTSTSKPPDPSRWACQTSLVWWKFTTSSNINVRSSKRRGGVENPITERWNTTKKPPQHVYSMYFQGYTVQKQPKLAESAKKKQGLPNKTPKGAPPTPKKPTNHVLAVRCCISIKQ